MHACPHGSCAHKLQRRALAAGPGAAGAPEVEVGVAVAGDLLVALGAHNLLDLLVDEVVEGVDVLAHQAPDLRVPVHPASSDIPGYECGEVCATRAWYCNDRPERWS